MTDNGSEERDTLEPKRLAPVQLHTDWERETWLSVYRGTMGMNATFEHGEKMADAAIRAVQARASVSQRSALERLKAKLGQARVRTADADRRLPARERMMVEAVAENVWRSAIAMVDAAIAEEKAE